MSYLPVFKKLMLYYLAQQTAAGKMQFVPAKAYIFDK